MQCVGITSVKFEFNNKSIKKKQRKRLFMYIVNQFITLIKILNGLILLYNT